MQENQCLVRGRFGAEEGGEVLVHLFDQFLILWAQIIRHELSFIILRDLLNAEVVHPIRGMHRPCPEQHDESTAVGVRALNLRWRNAECETSSPLALTTHPLIQLPNPIPPLNLAFSLAPSHINPNHPPLAPPRRGGRPNRRAPVERWAGWMPTPSQCPPCGAGHPAARGGSCSHPQ